MPVNLPSNSVNTSDSRPAASGTRPQRTNSAGSATFVGSETSRMPHADTLSSSRTSSTTEGLSPQPKTPQQPSAASQHDRQARHALARTMIGDCVERDLVTQLNAQLGCFTANGGQLGMNLDGESLTALALGLVRSLRITERLVANLADNHSLTTLQHRANIPEALNDAEKRFWGLYMQARVSAAVTQPISQDVMTDIHFISAHMPPTEYGLGEPSADAHAEGLRYVATQLTREERGMLCAYLSTEPAQAYARGQLAGVRGREAIMQSVGEALPNALMMLMAQRMFANR